MLIDIGRVTSMSTAFSSAVASCLRTLPYTTAATSVGSEDMGRAKRRSAVLPGIAPRNIALRAAKLWRVAKTQ